MGVAPEIVWFVAGLVLVLLEFAVPGVIVVFFGAGAWVTALATWAGLTPSLDAQLLVFSAASLGSLLSLRRWIRGRFTGHVADEQDPSANYDDFSGRTVTALEDLVPGRAGPVEFRGTRWQAVSDCALGRGEQGRIERLDGITLIITKAGGRG